MKRVCQYAWQTLFTQEMTLMTYKRIYLFTQPNCPSCDIVKKYLSFQKVFFEEFDISKDSTAKHKMIHDYQSYSTPTVVVGKEVIRGLDLDRLERLLNQDSTEEDE